MAHDPFVCSPEVLPRLGAALWGLTGQVLKDSDLFWADRLLGMGGKGRLRRALEQQNVLQGGRLDAPKLATWLSHLAGGSGQPQLLWTLPAGHPNVVPLGGSYRASLAKLIDVAQSELLIVSPFLHIGGVKPVQDALLAALLRGVQVTIIAHDLNEPDSVASRAVENLRRAAQRARARFIAYTAQPESGLVHAKLVLQDDQAVIIGSANLTAPGYGFNFEAGVLLGREAVPEVRLVVQALLSTPMVELIFQTAIES